MSRMPRSAGASRPAACSSDGLGAARLTPLASSRAGNPDFSKKHPLETPWTLWFDNPNGKQKQSTWGQTLRAVYTFSTVEDFWW